MALFIVELIIFLVAFIVWKIYDDVITRKRLSQNQKEWDEYCKDMTLNERGDCFIDWCKEQKVKNGWRLLYIPNMCNIQPKVFECKINDIKYRGTIEEIAKQSNTSLEYLLKFDVLPLEIKTN